MCYNPRREFRIRCSQLPAAGWLQITLMLNKLLVAHPINQTIPHVGILDLPGSWFNAPLLAEAAQVVANRNCFGAKAYCNLLSAEFPLLSQSLQDRIRHRALSAKERNLYACLTRQGVNRPAASSVLLKQAFTHKVHERSRDGWNVHRRMESSKVRMSDLPCLAGVG